MFLQNQNQTITKEDTTFRKAIGAEEKLTVTLR